MGTGMALNALAFTMAGIVQTQINVSGDNKNYVEVLWKFLNAAQKMSFSFKDVFSKCEKICCSHLLKKILKGRLNFLCCKGMNNLRD